MDNVCGVGREPSRFELRSFAVQIQKERTDGQHWHVSLRLADGSGAGEADDARKAWKDGRGD